MSKSSSTPGMRLPWASMAFTDIWVNQGNWTVTSVRWQGSEVVAAGEPLTVTAPALWEIQCRVYTVNFSHSFMNGKGVRLSEAPSSFSLVGPNGTTTEELTVDIYLLQNGTFTWKTIRWRGHDVIPPTASNFEATSSEFAPGASKR